MAAEYFHWNGYLKKVVLNVQFGIMIKNIVFLLTYKAGII